MKRFAHQPILFSKNHDSIAIEPVLEACVVRFLINESVVVRKGRESFTPRGRGRHRALSCSDLERAFTGRESGLTALLNHSPTEYREAAGGGRLSHRAHPRWPDLPARRHPTYVQLLNAAPSGFGGLALSEHDWLYQQGCWQFDGACTVQLPAGDCGSRARCTLTSARLPLPCAISRSAAMRRVENG